MTAPYQVAQHGEAWAVVHTSAPGVPVCLSEDMREAYEAAKRLNSKGVSTMFHKASKQQARLRLALIGPSGSGKTFTALRVAAGLGARVALIDTERASASKYADRFSFDTVELEDFHPQRYVDAIRAADAEGYDVLVIDSLSHAWEGRGGALELVDNAAKRSRSGNSFTAWKEVTPLHHQLVDAILRSRCHVIATMRTKTEWVLEEKNGKQTPRKVGLAPIQRQGVEYEFDVVGDLDEASLVVSKSRCPALTKAVIQEPGEELGKQLKAWLTDGAPMPEHSPMPPPNANGPQGKLRKPDPDPEIPFGPAKGKRLSQLSLKETRTYIQITEGQLAKPGDQYADANTRRLRLLQEHEKQLLEAEEDEIRHAEESEHAPA